MQIVPLLLKHANGNKKSLSKKSVSSQTNSLQTYSQTQGAFNAALVGLAKIIAKYGKELFLANNKQKLTGLLSDLFRQSNEFYPKLKEAFATDFAELILLATKKSESEKNAALEKAGEMLAQEANLQNEDAAAIARLVAFALDWDLEM